MPGVASRPKSAMSLIACLMQLGWRSNLGNLGGGCGASNLTSSWGNMWMLPLTFFLRDIGCLRSSNSPAIGSPSQGTIEPSHVRSPQPPPLLARYISTSAAAPKRWTRPAPFRDEGLRCSAGIKTGLREGPHSRYWGVDMHLGSVGSVLFFSQEFTKALESSTSSKAHSFEDRWKASLGTENPGDLIRSL